MKIGFYGHSNCAYRSKDSFIDLIADHFSAEVVNVGVKQGSEERVLFELKKTKNIDVAVIFHCPASCLFLPECDRDIDIKSFDFSKVKNLFENFHLDSEFVETYQPKFKEVFKTDFNFFECIETYKKYLHHPDLMMNRYYGALSQIDQYIKFKNIFVIHVIDKKLPIPDWFSFSNGIVNTEIMEIVNKFPAKNPFYVNAISKEANLLVSNLLINIIAARGREDIRLRETQETEVRIPRLFQ